MKLCLRFLSIPLLTVALAACGVTGETSRRTVDLDDPSQSALIVPVETVAVSLRPGGARLVNVGVYPWGKFSDSDLSNLQGSIEDSLNAALDGKPLDMSDRLQISVVVQHYVVASSNDEIAVLAAVDWCAAFESGKAVFREGFYAAISDDDLTTLGIVKNAANEAIVRRVGVNSLALAGGDAGTRFDPRTTAATYDAYEDALSVLPKSLRPSGFVISAPTPVYVEGGDAVALPWQAAMLNAGSACEVLRR